MVLINVLNPYNPEQDFSFELDSSKKVCEVKAYLERHYPQSPPVKEQKLIFSGKIYDDDTNIAEICRKTTTTVGNKQNITCHLILPLFYKPTAPTAHESTPALPAQSTSVAFSSLPRPSIFANSPPSSDTNNILREAQEIRALLNNLGSQQQTNLDPIFFATLSTNPTTLVTSTTRLNDSARLCTQSMQHSQSKEGVTDDPACDVNIYRTVNDTSLATALREFEIAHERLLDTIVLSRRLQALTQRWLFTPQPLLTVARGDRLDEAVVHRQHRVSSDFLATVDEHAHGAEMGSRTSTVELQQERPNVLPEMAVRIQAGDRVQGQGEDAPMQLGNRRAHGNERERIRPIRLLDFGLIFRIGFMLFLFGADSADWSDPTFVGCLLLGLLYYVYETGLFTYLFGFELNVAGLFNSFGRSNFALVPNSIYLRGPFYDSIVVLKTFFLSLLPTWRPLEQGT